MSEENGLGEFFEGWFATLEKGLDKLENRSLEEILSLAEEKRAERGGFDNMVFLEKVIE